MYFLTCSVSGEVFLSAVWTWFSSRLGYLGGAQNWVFKVKRLVWGPESGAFGALLAFLTIEVPTGRLCMVLYAHFILKKCTFTEESSYKVSRDGDTSGPCSRWIHIEGRCQNWHLLSHFWQIWSSLVWCGEVEVIQIAQNVTCRHRYLRSRH